MLIAIAQYNAIVGDLTGNAQRLLAAAHHAKAAGADLLVTPELALTGYPPRDLLERPAFVADALKTLAHVAQEAPLPMILGALVSAYGPPLSPTGTRICNAAVVLRHGEVVACHRKVLLPNYDIFDEPRYFSAGSGPTLVRLGDTTLALSVCEDAWNDKDFWPDVRYATDPVAEAVALGAECVINISASPFDRHKPAQRTAMIQALTRRHKVPVLYVNQVGGNDGLIFDGRSMAVNSGGTIAARCAPFCEELSFVTYANGAFSGELRAEVSSAEEDVTEALCLGLSDYVRKCGFGEVLVGLSGGIDSAVVAALAVRTLGASHVMGVAMPSRYSSQGSLDDARALAQNLGIRLDETPIDPMVRAFEGALGKPFAGMAPDITEENLQARVRGTLLMAYSNKFGALLLTTGNKSEVAVGYCTLYGDMNGGLGVISDLYKTEVYALAHHLNSVMQGAPIPQSTLTKAPSAELRPGQVDQDSLPPYEELDGMLHGYVDEGRSVADLASQGFSPDWVRKVAGMVAKSEHKRRQMAPGLRVSRKAFGEGRRLPVAQRWGY
jgi:NAD+ synthase/NAD+ synthase (glutamine-hydrolysing)